MVNGCIPKSSRKAFEAEYLGIRARGVYNRKLAEEGWLLIGQKGGNGSVFIAHAKTPLLRTATVGKAQDVPFKIVAFIKKSDIGVTQYRAVHEEHCQLHHWYTPATSLLASVAAIQKRTLAKFKAGDKLYLKEARRLHAWLAWDLLKHVPEAPSS